LAASPHITLQRSTRLHHPTLPYIVLRVFSSHITLRRSMYCVGTSITQQPLVLWPHFTLQRMTIGTDEYWHHTLFTQIKGKVIYNVTQ